MYPYMAALMDFSTQRADFGEYQNRLEHTYNANKNTEEDTKVINFENEIFLRKLDGYEEKSNT